MEMTVRFFWGILEIFRFFFIETFVLATSDLITRWPYDDGAGVWVSLMCGMIFTAFAIALPIMRSLGNEIEQEPPQGSGGIIINPDALIVRILHEYFGKYPKSSCHFIRYAVGLSLALVSAFYGITWFVLGASASVYFHLPIFIDTAPSVISSWFLGAISWGAGVTVSIVNATVAIVYFLIAPTVLFTMLFLTLLVLFWRSSLKTQAVSLGTLIKNTICFKIEYRPVKRPKKEEIR